MLKSLSKKKLIKINIIHTLLKTKIFIFFITFNYAVFQIMLIIYFVIYY